MDAEIIPVHITQFDNTPTVVCVIVPLLDGSVLSIRRAHEPGKGKLGLPGGYQRAGETWREAGAREVKEETGFVLDPTFLLMCSMETDEYGNNLVIAEYIGKRDYEVVTHTDGEATGLVRVTPYANYDWTFPRPEGAVGEWFRDEEALS